MFRCGFSKIGVKLVKNVKGKLKKGTPRTESFSAGMFLLFGATYVFHYSQAEN
jgi:hypothetical protein